jgi:electron transport complex protein RnfC
VFKHFPFYGGIPLEPHKACSAGRLLRDAPLPERLIYPLLARDGARLRPVAKIGDRVLKGQAISQDEGPLRPPIHAASSGWVCAIELRLLPHPSALHDLCVVIETDGQDESVEFFGMPDYRSADADALRAAIHAAGVVGMGGGAFPTSVKLDSGTVDTLIINGVECEPYISCDDALLRHYPHETLRGAQVIMHILQAKTCLFAVEEDMPQAIASLKDALKDALKAGDYANMQIATLPALYPMGSEKQLVKALTGREIPVGGIPAEIGVICMNAGTAAAVFRAVVKGEPLISRIVTVTGAGVRQAQNVLARIGTPIADLIRLCGGYTPSAHRLIVGGPMMGHALPSDEAPIVKGTNCILAAGEGDIMENAEIRPCIRCGECARACPVELLPQQLYWHIRANHIDKALEHHLKACIECGCCDYVCPSHIPLTQAFRSAKNWAFARDIERQNAERARLRFEARQARKAQESAEKAEQDRRKKASLARRPEIQRTMDRTQDLQNREACSDLPHEQETRQT